ncbi:hypothetical protein D7X94_05110 [Acutalibacter sp. 1XD8-33]|nr:hypothetical protein D7X94_05110 [Acutalibacter sp. 1XD8-33]
MIRHRRYTLRGGYVNQNTSNLFRGAGNEGDYWSSTPKSDGSNAYYFYFNDTSNIKPSDNANRNNGFSVRCLCCARSPKLCNIRKSQPTKGWG